MIYTNKVLAFLTLIVALLLVPCRASAQSAPDFKVYVALTDTNSVAVIDGLTNTVLTTIPIAAATATGSGTRPFALALTPDARYLYVVNESCGLAAPPKVPMWAPPSKVLFPSSIPSATWLWQQYPSGCVPTVSRSHPTEPEPM